MAHGGGPFHNFFKCAFYLCHSLIPVYFRKLFQTAQAAYQVLIIKGVTSFIRYNYKRDKIVPWKIFIHVLYVIKTYFKHPKNRWAKPAIRHSCVFAFGTKQI
jgi:riboflavin transporter FmnP